MDKNDNFFVDIGEDSPGDCENALQERVGEANENGLGSSGVKHLNALFETNS